VPSWTFERGRDVVRYTCVARAPSCAGVHLESLSSRLFRQPSITRPHHHHHHHHRHTTTPPHHFLQWLHPSSLASSGPLSLLPQSTTYAKRAAKDNSRPTAARAKPSASNPTRPSSPPKPRRKTTSSSTHQAVSRMSTTHRQNSCPKGIRGRECIPHHPPLRQ
jgi:hypothetical protein